MAARQISTNAEFIQIDTTTNAGTVLLPSAIATAGRILTFKDTAGTFFNRPFTLSTNGTDRFENGANQMTLREPFGYLTLASDGINRWFALDGTSLPSYTIPSLTSPLQISTNNISSSAFTVSTLGFVDRSFNTVSSIYTRSTLLFLGSNVIGGSKCGPTQFISVRIPFQPNQITGLNLWLDGSDLNTIALNGNSVLRWNDKSGNNRTANAAIAPTYSLNGIMFNGAQYLSVINATGLFTNTAFSIFIVERLTGASGYVIGDDVVNGGGAVNGSLHIGYRSTANFAFAFYGNDLEITGLSGVSTRIWSLNMPSVNNRNAILNGTLVATSGNNSKLTTMTSLTLGRVFGGAYYTGTIYEILGYVGELSTTQRQQVEGYLAWKWNLVASLPPTHPYKNIPP